MTNEQKLFDLAFLEEMDDNDFVTDVIVAYLRSTPEDLELLKKSFDSGNFDSLYKMAHKIKGSTGMLQANKLYDILAQIESIAKAGTANSQLANLTAAALSEFQLLKSALKKHLEVLQATV